MARGAVPWPLLAAALVALLAAALALLTHQPGGAAGQAAPVAGGSAASTGSATEGSTGCSGGAGNAVCTPLELVILGLRGCPHCRAMEDWLPGLGYPVAFCDIRESIVCSDAFTALYNRGLARGVPVVAVCSAGRLLLVEVGELRDRGWWLRALRGGTAGVGGVPVYWGTRLVDVLTGDAVKELSKAICRDALRAARPVEGAG